MFTSIFIMKEKRNGRNEEKGVKKKIKRKERRKSAKDEERETEKGCRVLPALLLFYERSEIKWGVSFNS